MSTNILIIAVLSVFSLFLEGAEAALLSSNPIKLRQMATKGDSRAQLVERMKKNTRRLLGTLLLGQKFCDVATASFATVAATAKYGSIGIGIATGVMTLFTLVFMNLIPKSLAASHPERWAVFVARPVHALTVVLGPLVNLIDRFVELFVKNPHAEVAVSEEEIRTMTTMGVSAGAVEHGEKELIDRVFRLNDITANDVMTPREIMVNLDARKPLGDALAVMNSHKYSRYPVFDGSPDTIIGIVHIKDVLAHAADQETLARLTVRDVMSPPVFVQESMLIDDLFREMKKQRVHMAILVSADKSLVGLVTLEDLLEELVGEISDESDIDEHVIKRLDKHTVLAHGDTDIPDINRFFNTRIEPGVERTVGRLVRRKAGKVPKQGQPVLIDEGLMAVVEQVSRGRILKVKLIKSVNGAQQKPS